MVLRNSPSTATHTARGSNPNGGNICHTCPDRALDPPSLMYNGYWVSCPRTKRPRREVDHPPPPTAGFKDIVELYLYSPPEPPWSVLGRLQDSVLQLFSQMFILHNFPYSRPNTCRRCSPSDINLEVEAAELVDTRYLWQPQAILDRPNTVIAGSVLVRNIYVYRSCPL